MRIVIVGGHMSPALAVMQALPKDVQVWYIGRKHVFEGDKGISLEYQTVTSLGIPFVPLTTGRLQRVWTRHSLFSYAKIPYGVFQAIAILRQIKPAVVLSFGGYLSLPVGIASFLLRIPLVIHEQTQDAGFSNVLLKNIATTIIVSFPTSLKYFPQQKTVLTGNPLYFGKATKEATQLIPQGSLPLLLVTGGSTGSHDINLFVEKHLGVLLDHYRVIHQTGDAQIYQDYDRLMILRSHLTQQQRSRYIVTKFISPTDISFLFNEAALVISRSGINSVMQLLVLEKPAILFPLRTGQKNEQLKNATFLQEAGLADIVTETDMSNEAVIRLIAARMKYHGITKEAKDIRSMHEKAAEHIVSLVYEAAGAKAKT